MFHTSVFQNVKVLTNLGITCSSFLLVLSGLMHPYAAEAQQKSFTHVEPPHWWAGMENPILEILIYGKDAGTAAYTLEGHTGVLLEGVDKFPNANYALLRLNVQNAPAQTFTIAAKGKALRIKRPYTLKARTASPMPIEQSDLIYLITPDRFANGDPRNDDIEGMNQRGVNRAEPYARHGGDIQGMINHLGYMQKLGVTAVWPNPLYENDQPKESYHGYAFTSHYRIDRRFGTNALFGNLCDSLHARGMKMVMDVVYNHVGNEHHIYKDMPDSSWFHNHKEYTQTNYRATTLMDPHASQYDRNRMTDGWFDRHMPDLNQRNPVLARYLIQQTLWWIEEYSIDALRIDTYAYPDQEFMVQWAREIKQHHPDLFIFAEIWDHGRAVQAYFLGDATGPVPNHIDGLTDFQVHFGINDALTRSPGWTEGINRLYYTMAADYLYSHPEKLVTFVDNHDVARFYGVVGKDFKKFTIGMGLLFTLRGIPSLYYGTELLMAETDGHGKIREDVMGGWTGDQSNKFSRGGRSEEENAAYDLISTLAQLRRTHPALATGRTTQFVPQEGMYAYFRHNDEETFLIAMNVTDKQMSRPLSMFSEHVPTGAGLELLLGDLNVEFGELHLPGYGFGIFKVVR